MDYSKMSDFEINKRVAIAVGCTAIYENDVAVVFRRDNDSPPVVVSVNAEDLACFNPCNNAADAWPIITANLMRITPIYGAEVIWLVSRDVHAATDENPLRAAMLVYLQLQEAK